MLIVDCADVRLTYYPASGRLISWCRNLTKKQEENVKLVITRTVGRLLYKLNVPVKSIVFVLCAGGYTEGSISRSSVEKGSVDIRVE
jgi:hypothetical protein